MKKRILFFIALAFAGLTLAGCGNKTTNLMGNNTYTGINPDNGSNTSIPQRTATELEKNISSSGAITARGKLIVFATNANDVPVNMDIEVEFYDATGMIVGSDSESLRAVGANSDIAIEMWSAPDSFDNYKIYVDVEQTEEISYFDKLQLVHNNNGEDIIVQVKNNSSDSIDYIKVSVVYYQGNKVVGYYDGTESDIKPGRAANFTLNFPYDKNYDNVRFDTYKVFINEAYSYNW